MKRTLTAVALLMAGQAWAQESALSPTAHRTVPTERPSENIALRASYTMEPGPSYDLCSDPGDAEQLTGRAPPKVPKSCQPHASMVLA